MVHNDGLIVSFEECVRLVRVSINESAQGSMPRAQDSIVLTGVCFSDSIMFLENDEQRYVLLFHC